MSDKDNREKLDVAEGCPENSPSPESPKNEETPLEAEVVFEPYKIDLKDLADPDYEDEFGSDKKTFMREAVEWIEMFTYALAVMIIIFTFFMRLVIVDGNSMNDTLRNRDYLVISGLFYTPETGDIVVLQVPRYLSDPNQSNSPLIKRVIATEGQKVDINFETWTVYIDGVPLYEPYIRREVNRSMKAGSISYPFIVEPGRVFVMGDNRNNSHDSRYRDIGQVDNMDIIGKVILRVFPFNWFGAVE